MSSKLRKILIIVLGLLLEFCVASILWAIGIDIVSIVKAIIAVFLGLCLVVFASTILCNAGTRKNDNRNKDLEKIIIIVVCAVLILIIAVAGLWFLKQLFVPELTIIQGAEEYEGRAAYFEDESEGFYSHLLIFPEKELEGMEIQNYYYSEEVSLFDNFYLIYLEYTLSDEIFQKEKVRLENISMEYKGKQQHIKEVEHEVFDAVYVAAWSEMRTCEYALLDEDNNKIICVFSQINELDNSVIPEQYLLDKEEMKREFGEYFDIYYFADGTGSYLMPELGSDEMKRSWIPME